MNKHDCKDISSRHEDGSRPVVCESLRQEREPKTVDESWEGGKQEHDFGEECEVPPVAVPVAEAEEGEKQEGPEEGHPEAQLDGQFSLVREDHTPDDEHNEGQEDNIAQPEGGVERDLPRELIVTNITFWTGMPLRVSSSLNQLSKPETLQLRFLNFITEATEARYSRK